MNFIMKDGKFLEQKPRHKGRSKPLMEGEGTFEFFLDPTGADDRDTLSALAPEEIAELKTTFERIATENERIFQDKTGGADIQREMTSEELEALRALGYAE